MIQIPEILVQINRVPAFAVGIPLVLGTGSGLITKTSVDSWYKDLEKPKGTPPKIAFPIVWTCLYAGMGYVGHLLSFAYDTSPDTDVRDAASLLIPMHWAQLGLNLAWTPLFFGLQKPCVALADIVALTGTVFTMTGLLSKIDKKATYIYAAYSAWLSYATYLNASIAYKNCNSKSKGKGKKTGDGQGSHTPNKQE